MATANDELAFLASKEKSSREEATAAERSKRAAEIEEMRRRRAEADGGVTDFQALRRALADKSAHSKLTTDMESWTLNQRQSVKDDRMKKLEANKNLHEFRGQGQVIPKRERKYAQSKFSSTHVDAKAKQYDAECHGGVGESNGEVYHAREADAGKEGDEHDESPNIDDMNNDTEIEHGTTQTQNVDSFMEEVGKASTPALVKDSTPEIVKATPLPFVKPTYARVDVKFSFGLIVRSNEGSGEGNEGEDLRENETLMKCMNATAKILIDQMPSPPDESLTDKEDISSYPEAYYDPNLTPTVISIEEEKKDGKADEGKTIKGTKRTLVKASFPVFLRNEAKDELGKKKSARVLKETKGTVFKSLRSAVSGGSFLR